MEVTAMPAAFRLSDVTVFLPVGGRATRALSVTEDVIPKHLIRLGNGLPILEVVCRQLQAVGFRRFVFCTGHHQEQIASYVRWESWVSCRDVDYELSVEHEPLGPEGAILAAMEALEAKGQALIIAGDMMVPWGGLAAMNEQHAHRRATVTAGLTGFVTERTTDVGRFIVDRRDGRIVRLYGRTEQPRVGVGEKALTSAGLSVVAIEPYVGLCRRYVDGLALDGKQIFGLRDDVLPWALREGEVGLYGHDLNGEVLDLGTPPNIRYGQKNWSQYVVT
jgi:NDP-sugar pyrophosphorylase family protein